MEFEIYLKNKDTYEKRLIIPPSGSDFSFFKSLKLKIEEEIENMKHDIISLFPSEDDVNLKHPIHEDKDKQEVINKIVEMKRINKNTHEILISILSCNEFIICKNCGGKMIKTPVNIPYRKIAGQYIIEIKPNEVVRYVYMCENCVNAISEENFMQIQNNKKTRQQMIDEGFNWVPNDFGCWYKLDDGKPMNRHPMFKEEGCDHRWKRHWETIKIKTGEEFLKLWDECLVCGKRIVYK